MTNLRCATVARHEGLDPLGTAGHYRGFLLVDWPLPWPSDLGEIEALHPLAEPLCGQPIAAAVKQQLEPVVVWLERTPA